MKIDDSTHIEELELSVRAYRCLKRAGWVTVGDVRTKRRDQLLSVKNLGSSSIDEIAVRLNTFGVLHIIDRDPDANDYTVIDNLELSTRAYRILMSNSIKTIGALRRTPRKKLLSLKGLGKGTVTEIYDRLKDAKIQPADAGFEITDYVFRVFSDNQTKQMKSLGWSVCGGFLPYCDSNIRRVWMRKPVNQHGQEVCHD